MLQFLHFLHHAHNLAGHWLTALSIKRPRVSVFNVAALLNHSIRLRPMSRDVPAMRRLTDNGYEITANSKVYGDETAWRRRVEYAICHEIMALQIPEIADEAGEKADPLYDLCAAQLLLYRPWLDEAVQSYGRDPTLLSDIFDVNPTPAARSLLEFGDGILTVMEGQRRLLRVGSGVWANAPPEQAAEETAVFHEARVKRKPSEYSDALIQVQAWPIRLRGYPNRVLGLTWLQDYSQK